MKYIVANWKQNKNEQDAVQWVHSLENAIKGVSDSVRVVLAAPFPLLPVLRETIDVLELPLGLAAQDISAYADGAFTGEVGGNQLQFLVDSVIIGHSERRMYFGDSNKIVAKKIRRALDFNLTCFVCIADQINEYGTVPEQKVDVPNEWFDMHVRSVFDGVSTEEREKIVLVYEPVSAISTFGGTPLTTKECSFALSKVEKIAENSTPVMYGGSVTEENVLVYWILPEVGGVMPGGASLLEKDFEKLLDRIAS